MAGVSTLGQALRQIDNIKSQQSLYSTLSTQLATGKKTQSYAGLESEALTTLRARNQLSGFETYNNNITKADTTIQLMLTTIEEYQEQSREFSGTITNFLMLGAHQQGEKILYDDPLTTEIEETVVGYTSAQPDNDFQSVIDHAENLYGFMIDLLNTQIGDRYIMAGADSLTKPLNESGTLDSAMNTLIAGWKDGTITTDDLIADLTDRSALDGNPDALTDTVIGYSSSLASGNTGNTYIRVNDNTELNYTALANEDGFRDILVGLAFLKNTNLPPIVDTYSNGVYPGTPSAQGAPGATAEEMEENFYQVYDAVVKMINNAVDDIDQVRFRLESTRVQMQETMESNKNQINLLTNTISSVEDVDTNEVAVKLTILETQLETSYQVTAIASGLSLINYL